MSLKVSVVDQFGEDKLHKGWYCAGIKPELFIILWYEMLGEHHITDAQRWGDRF